MRHQTTITYDKRGAWVGECDSCTWTFRANSISTTEQQARTSGAIHESEKWSELMRWMLS